MPNVPAHGLESYDVNGELIESGGGSALTYPTFFSEWYGPQVVTASTVFKPPLSMAGDAYFVQNDANWTVADDGADVGVKLILPPGVYSVLWYWEQSGGTGEWFDNYISVGVIPSSYTETYPTAPKAHPTSTWGSASANVKLVGAGTTNYLKLIVENKDASSRTFSYSSLSVTRLDA